MKIYETQEEVNADLDERGNLFVDDDVRFAFNIEITGSITARNIIARSMNVGRINAWNVNTRDINAEDINVHDISAWDITARNITARNIATKSINAWDIKYFAVCFAYENIICNTIKGKRENCRYFCLDGKIIEGQIK
jgi:hypothetical protein